MTDVEQQQQQHGAVTDKPTLSDSATPLRTSWARRLVPTNRYARYLCFGTIFVVVIFVVAFLALWFTTRPITIVPTLARPEVYETDASPVQWKLYGTKIWPLWGWWGIKVLTRNENVFDIVLQGVDMTATISTTSTTGRREVLLGTTPSTRGEMWVPAKRTLEVKEQSFQFMWDLSIAEQARSLATLLVLCGVNATSLPAPLTSRWDLPDPSDKNAALVKWYVRARRVRGLLGLPMPSTDDAPQGFWVPEDEPRESRADTWQRVEEVFCAMEVENRGKVARHIQQLANLTVRACESGMCQY
ncbi:hypothetical protein AMAG_16742 [Allomyces macrogynus ATCC 38327]|uniref:Uncharacterized protein n=1 Tax=Allomyces macrogynus (strain ATCC 38327) TaxID=578462 RepID=A0A0L0TC11_ALLM3|nr:hypothetical protein AMAG_16742 [Allomyces macrogynus ATCC 38327]|eukprot:KNE72256.1 hypothetical protein AMAG_16742 [Allomyces macrogynus ATCC 38327]